jgi:tetratricopeptide (TPR) repeat protein
VALGALGRFDEAIIHCQEALKRSPHAPAEVHFNLALALARRGRFDEAIAHYRQGLEIKPDDARARGFLGAALARRGRLAESLAQFEQAVRLKPDDVDAQISLAWLRATCAEASLRDGAAAIEHAERALRLCDGRRVDVLDALGAAYAEVGRFPEALAAARKALELALQQHSRPLAATMRGRIALYEAGKPLHQRLPAATSSH